MIVVDSSALIAILLDEPDRQIFEDIITGGERCTASAVNVHERITVLRARSGTATVERLWRFMKNAEMDISSFDEVQVRAASFAFDRYGKGIHAKARLNICDCAAYALAKTMNAPLLFKGDDFIHTDVQNALSPTK